MLYIDSMTVYANPVPFNFTDVTNDDLFYGDYAFNNNSINEQYDHLKTITRIIENDNYNLEISRDRDVNRENIASEDTVNTPLPSPQEPSPQEKLTLSYQESLNKIRVLKEEKNNLEKSYEWKFLTDPEKYPCNYQWFFKSPDLNITANVKFNSIQDRDRLLSDNFDDSPIDIPKLNFFDPKPFYNAIERNAELSARNYLLATQERHTQLTKEIQSNESELRNIQISIEKSSVLTIPTPLIPVNSGSSTLDETTRMDTSVAQAIENKLNAIGDKLAETFECSFGFACASDLDKAAKNPNLGKELSNSDKIELGGTVSGTPDGWGPEDEAHARTHQIPSKEELKQGASEINRNGLTNAGRSLQKHGGREGSVYSYSNQKASVLNQEARAIIDEILDNPNVTIKSRTVYENRQRIEVIDARSPDGRTLRFSRDGKKFIGFREP
ncbi:TPA: adhesin [Providencia alcalifaciens]